MNTAQCDVALDSVLERVSRNLTAFGELRNGRTLDRLELGWRFVSAELHLYEDTVTEIGDILTWATPVAGDGDEFVAVDVRAREESSWPPAPFDVREDGAVESRGCVEVERGFHCDVDPGLPPEEQRAQCDEQEDAEEERQDQLVAARDAEEQGADG